MELGITQQLLRILGDNMGTAEGPRRHFAKVMTNPYFQSNHYINETNSGKAEKKIIEFLYKLFRKKGV